MSASGATAGIHHVTRTTDRDVPRPDTVTTRRQPAAALTVELIDAARRAVLNNVFPGSFDNVLRDVQQVLAERAGI